MRIIDGTSDFLPTNIHCVFLAIFRKIIVLIPLIFILPNILSNHIFAVFVAEPIADFIAVSTTVTLFIKNFKKTLAQMSYERS